jgi:hypothetical protein
VIPVLREQIHVLRELMNLLLRTVNPIPIVNLTCRNGFGA